MDLYVYNALTKRHVLVKDNFVINRHNTTHSCIILFPVSTPFLTHGHLSLYGYPIRRSVIHIWSSIDTLMQSIDKSTNSMVADTLLNRLANNQEKLGSNTLIYLTNKINWINRGSFFVLKYIMSTIKVHKHKDNL